MAVPIGAVVSLMTRTWPLLVKYGPRALGAVGLLSKFLASNPAVPAWFKGRLADLPHRLNDAERKSTEVERLRATLQVVRDVVEDAETAEGMDGSGYRTRADRIERGLRLVETQSRAQQKVLIARSRSDTEALLAEVLEAVTGAAAPAAGDGEHSPSGGR